MTQTAPQFRKSVTPADARTAAGVIARAFSHDPTWQPIVMPTEDHLPGAQQYWEMLTTSAIRYPWSYLSEDGAVASVWYPPGATRFTDEELAGFPDFTREVLGEERSAQLSATLEALARTRPDFDHFYLSLLAVHPDHRGSGLGMRLLRDNLREIDQLGLPTYLVSSNPANDRKYESIGYRPYREILLPSGLTINTFVRDAGGDDAR